MSGPYYDWSTQDAWAPGAWLPGTWASGAFGPDVWLPSGGSAYTAKAVHFDGATILKHPGLVSPSDNQFASFVTWFRCSVAAPPPNNVYVLYSVDPSRYPTNGNNIGFETDAATYAEAWFGPDGAWGTSYIGPFGPDTGVLPLDAWYCVMSSTNIRTPSFTDTQLYIGDQGTTGLDGSATDINSSSNVEFNGLPIWIGSDDDPADPIGGPFPFTGDVADFRIYPGLQIDFSVEANRRLFIDASGKPVDPSVAAAALGTSGLVKFSGNASDWTSQATAQGFSVTGTLTNATTSPSD